MPQGYQLIERAPTLQEYRHICIGVGWEDVMNFEAAATGLQNASYSVVALHRAEAVGMGRIISDGALYFYIQDLAVLPDHQRQGVGGQIMEHIMAYLRRNAPEKAFIGLFAAPEHRNFYERFGFRVYSFLDGMYQIMPLDRSALATGNGTALAQGS